MGLFGKIFDKKECAICGGEIGLLGNRKLEDGNMCKNCASKLSPWMTDRRESTVAEIEQHLAYREENKRLVPTMHPTRVFGSGSYKLYFDAGKNQFFVTSRSDWREGNPDIVDISQVTDCDVKVNEYKSEQYREGPDGKRESYNPPKYDFSYSFTITIYVDSPYFDVIRFELNGEKPTSKMSREYRDYQFEADELRAALMPGTYAPPVPQASAAETLGSIIKAAASAVTAAASGAANGQWTCRKCGSVNTGKFCSNCGAKQAPAFYRCNRCGYVPDDPANPPKFCPQCGDPFNSADAR